MDEVKVQNEKSPSKRLRKSFAKEIVELNVKPEPVDIMIHEANKHHLFKGAAIVSDWQGIVDLKHLVRERNKHHVDALRKVCKF